MARNEIDLHTDTCCAGANWHVIDFTGEFCDDNPFLDSYEPVQEVPLVKYTTVFTDKGDGAEMLLMADQMLWFETQLPHSLINPNQIRAYGISVNDNSFGDGHDFGIDLDEGLIPFETEGTIIYFETWSPTDHELKELPVVLLADLHWDPTDNSVYPHGNATEFNDLRAIWSLR
eukprot:9774960-Ditylum_brightwellii.AAC.1